MTMTASVELPPQIARRLAEFCAAAKSGTLQLDILNGKIEAWRLTETGRVDKHKQ